MKERPILFSAPMVRALLDGSKTQTRRVIKDQVVGERYSHALDDGRVHLEWLGEPTCGSGVWDVPEHSMQITSPYGLIGDRLWVRETWMDLTGTGIERSTGDHSRYAYGADTPPGSYGDQCRKDYGLKWRPSIHMPRAASRITLEVTGVRVERLQAISRGDAMAEGCPFPNMATGDDPRQWFTDLWSQINGAESWDANPWVWVVEFRRLTA